MDSQTTKRWRGKIDSFAAGQIGARRLFLKHLDQSLSDFLIVVDLGATNASSCFYSKKVSHLLLAAVLASAYYQKATVWTSKTQP